MNAVLTPENRLGLPDIPEYTQNKGGILAPKDCDGISLPRDAGKVLTPKGYSGEQGVSIPQGDEVIKYGVLGGSVERKNISPSEIALAFGNFDVYFERRIQEYFPSHEKLSEKPARLNYERVYEEKMYFDRSLGRRESIRLSKPGPVEEECVVAVRIASDPSFVGTSVAKKAIDKASALLYSGRTETDKGYQQQLPEMPALLAEVRTYLGRLHTQRGLRYEVYDLLDQIRVPASEISTLGILMDQNGDLKHPLAYRLLAESTPDSEFYEQQLERREKILSLLSGDAEKMTEMYPYLKDLARGVVCSMDLKNPPNGRVGLELEFGLGTTGTLGCPSWVYYLRRR